MMQMPVSGLAAGGKAGRMRWVGDRVLGEALRFAGGSLVGAVAWPSHVVLLSMSDPDGGLDLIVNWTSWGWEHTLWLVTFAVVGGLVCVFRSARNTYVLLEKPRPRRRKGVAAVLTRRAREATWQDRRAARLYCAGRRFAFGAAVGLLVGVVAFGMAATIKEAAVRLLYSALAFGCAAALMGPLVGFHGYE